MQRLPGGPDESSRIQELTAEIADSARQAAELRPHIVLRPVPSTYHELRKEIADFVARSCDPERMREALGHLEVCSAPATTISPLTHKQGQSTLQLHYI